MKRFKKWFLSHPILKVLSVLLAFGIWLLIVNISNPVMTRTIRDIPVTIKNQSYVESLGMSYKLAGGQSTVSVAVQSNRSVVENLTADDVTVTADLTQIIDTSSSPVMVPLSVSVTGISSELVTLNPRNIQIELEDMKTREMVIVPSAGTTSPSSGYEVGGLSVEPSTVTVKGPESLIEKIERIVASVDVSNLTADADLAAQYVVYDKNGEAFGESDLGYLTFSVSEKSLNVHVTLYKVVTVSVEGETSGTPASGYEVSYVEATPSSLAVVGDSKALKTLEANGNLITVSDEGILDVTGLSDDEIFDVDITSYLPEGISLAKDSVTSVRFEVVILPYNSKTITFSTKNIKVKGIASGLRSVFDVSEIQMKISAEESVLESVDADGVTATVDLRGYTAGSYSNVPVSVTLPEGCTLVESVKVALTLTEIDSVSSEESDGASSSSSSSSSTSD